MMALLLRQIFSEAELKVQISRCSALTDLGAFIAAFIAYREWRWSSILAAWKTAICWSASNA